MIGGPIAVNYSFPLFTFSFLSDPMFPLTISCFCSLTFLSHASTCLSLFLFTTCSFIFSLCGFFVSMVLQSFTFYFIISLILPQLFRCAGNQNAEEQILSEFLLFRYARFHRSAHTHDSKGAFGSDLLGIKVADFPAPEMDIVPLKIISYLFISDIPEYE